MGGGGGVGWGGSGGGLPLTVDWVAATVGKLSAISQLRTFRLSEEMCTCRGMTRARISKALCRACL